MILVAPAELPCTNLGIVLPPVPLPLTALRLAVRGLSATGMEGRDGGADVGGHHPVCRGGLGCSHASAGRGWRCLLSSSHPGGLRSASQLHHTQVRFHERIQPCGLERRANLSEQLVGSRPLGAARSCCCRRGMALQATILEVPAESRFRGGHRTGAGAVDLVDGEVTGHDRLRDPGRSLIGVAGMAAAR